MTLWLYVFFFFFLKKKRAKLELALVRIDQSFSSGLLPVLPYPILSRILLDLVLVHVLADLKKNFFFPITAVGKMFSLKGLAFYKAVSFCLAERLVEETEFPIN